MKKFYKDLKKGGIFSKWIKLIFMQSDRTGSSDPDDEFLHKSLLEEAIKEQEQKIEDIKSEIIENILETELHQNWLNKARNKKKRKLLDKETKEKHRLEILLKTESKHSEADLTNSRAEIELARLNAKKEMIRNIGFHKCGAGAYKKYQREKNNNPQSRGR